MIILFAICIQEIHYITCADNINLSLRLRHIAIPTTDRYLEPADNVYDWHTRVSRTNTKQSNSRWMQISFHLESTAGTPQ